MLRNAEYIYNNILKADETNTTLQYCKKAQVGVDLTVRNVLDFQRAGIVLKSKTYASATKPIPMVARDSLDNSGEKITGWFLEPGTYIAELNEGCAFGPNDTGYLIMRSSLNRSGVGIESAVWDPGYTSVDGDKTFPMSIRMTVSNPYGFFVEKDARIAQLVVAENESTSIYNGQWQGGRNVSKLV